MINPEVAELGRRLRGLPDEELRRMLTTERAAYRQTALDLAAEELMHRGVALPTPAAVAGSVREGDERADESPYKFIDLVFDLFFGTLFLIGCVWLWSSIDELSIPGAGPLAEEVIKGALLSLFTMCVTLIHSRWRTPSRWGR